MPSGVDEPRGLAGAVVGARLAAQRIVELTGASYIDTLDAVLGRLEDGVPLAAQPLPPAE